MFQFDIKIFLHNWRFLQFFLTAFLVGLAIPQTVSNDDFGEPLDVRKRSLSSQAFYFFVITVTLVKIAYNLFYIEYRWSDRLLFHDAVMDCTFFVVWFMTCAINSIFSFMPKLSNCSGPLLLEERTCRIYLISITLCWFVTWTFIISFVLTLKTIFKRRANLSINSSINSRLFV
ncbi:hypothetical protein Glove_140g147 [Diversispora epigaea]|uniref:Uncharacterized protein n=1 Tax=Diversispora epigaea TaxID=1348612 RepID=A0A397J3M4_9GLOM|nr:hypothetical protein Glove_140g147 [Diversispora epigaea]